MYKSNTKGEQKLTDSTVQIIKATAPVVAEHAETITSKMYEILFTTHPELKQLFSDAGSDQHKKLASAVAAYAANIDNLGILNKAVDQIVTSHVRTNVQPEHYPLVGAAILEAISSTLGDAATPEILKAWKEAFFFLADTLITKEKAA